MTPNERLQMADKYARARLMCEYVLDRLAWGARRLGIVPPVECTIFADDVTSGFAFVCVLPVETAEEFQQVIMPATDFLSAATLSWSCERMLGEQLKLLAMITGPPGAKLAEAKGGHGCEN